MTTTIPARLAPTHFLQRADFPTKLALSKKQREYKKSDIFVLFHCPQFLSHKKYNPDELCTTTDASPNTPN